ncbi:ABC transporter permease [Oceanomicrobium pacificus]|uniref:FtsX-like permease family protein n=1 Tax=Oceanomicrobium pacificus TaxID=2692916 RepID=A0A6B0TV48_9RHOB|nr:ABC transporter permease [Oceanomicrobium pacificus]MXU65082.1 FtsX-like permease family protein [Oceanomicrobium pacificus]
MFGLAFGSLWNRRFLAALTILSIALSVALILGVERLRNEARNGFANSASGIDLIVAPRGNSVQILMATVFGAGSTGTGLTWDTYQTVEALDQVGWAVPMQMGDNHRGYPVIGTERSYFDHFRHSGGQMLEFAEGRPFGAGESEEAVIGADVAERFGYGIGDVIVNAHGLGDVSFDMHDEAPFEISGILARTGTATDKMVFVSLAGFDEIHAERTPPEADPFAAESIAAAPDAPAQDVDHEGADGHDAEAEHGHDETHADGEDHDDHGHADESHGEDDHDHADDAHGDDQEDPHDHAHEPDQINAIYVGLKDRRAILGLQRQLTELRTDPVSAVIPAVALAELWSITGTAERAMLVMGWAVALAGMIGMIVMLSATLETRRREFAILRSVGATPGSITGMIVTEAALLMAGGILAGLALLAAATALANPVLSARFGLSLPLWIDVPQDLGILLGLFAAGLVAALIPAARVYRMTLADGLSIRL